MCSGVSRAATGMSRFTHTCLTRDGYELVTFTQTSLYMCISNSLHICSNCLTSRDNKAGGKEVLTVQKSATARAWILQISYMSADLPKNRRPFPKQGVKLHLI